MQSDQHLIYRSGDLSICPQLGEVSNNHGDSTRLGPVNMKVLSLLLSRPQTLVSRSDIFDTIWKNQVVSDDALTRCISDIRGQLKTLSPNHDFIETLPRRGYRWMLDVNNSSAPSEFNGAVSEHLSAAEPNNSIKSPKTSIYYWFGRGLIYLAVILIIASASVWLLDRFNQPTASVVAVLPSQAQTNSQPLAIQLEKAIATQLITLGNMRLLSKTALNSRPSNPFPYLYFEFGVRWVIESEIRELGAEKTVTLTLVDARTGLILHQETETLINVQSGNTIDWGKSQALSSFIDYLKTLNQ